MKNYKLWLCGITSTDNEAALKDMIEPVIQYFDGLNWTFHLPKDAGAEFLEANKKEGKIVYAEWCKRHGYSMTHFLWQGNMKNGDYFVVLDTPERISPLFAQKIPELISQIAPKGVGVITNYGKPFIIRYIEDMRFEGSPHWFPVNHVGNVVNIEVGKENFWSVRDKTRGDFHFVNHYLKYYLYPRGSNHCLLGLEKNGNPQELFPAREATRLKFLEYVDELGIGREPEKIIEFMKKQYLPERLKLFINSEKILNDVYRYFVLSDKNFKDDHDFKNMIFVP
jgi:hypothetical protein